jgi:coenzyme Q-binding protein COQ10
MLTFHIEFEFRSTLLQALVGGLFNEAVRRMVVAFEGRAKRLYGGQQVRPGLRELARS